MKVVRFSPAGWGGRSGRKQTRPAEHQGCSRDRSASSLPDRHAVQLHPRTRSATFDRARGRVGHRRRDGRPGRPRTHPAPGGVREGPRRRGWAGSCFPAQKGVKPPTGATPAISPRPRATNAPPMIMTLTRVSLPVAQSGVSHGNW